MAKLDIDRPKKFRNKKKSKIISFDSEIVTKENAEEILKNEEKHIKKQNIFKNTKDESLKNTNHSADDRKHKKSKKNNVESLESSQLTNQRINKKNKDSELKTNVSSQNDGTENVKLKKSKQRESGKFSEEKSLTSELEETEETDINEKTESIKPPKKESKRAQKRKKFEVQVAAKKLKSEVSFQEKALNYLSKWKHCRSQWKFEKLRQVWLQQNLFDSTKLPEEFWEAAVEYFSGSKGQSRQQLLDEAVKIVEQEEESEISVEEDKLKRARDIVQHLQ